MIARRVVFLIAVIVLLFAGLATGHYIYFAALLTLFFVLVFGATLDFLMVLGFNCSIEVSSKSVLKSDKVTLILSIKNYKPVIYPLVRLHFQTPGSIILDETEVCDITVPPFSSRKVEKEVRCNLRGVYTLGIEKAELIDMFGLFSYKIDVKSKPYYKPVTLTVCPRILFIKNFPLLTFQQEGIKNSHVLGTNETSVISDNREYRYGDPLKKIHWNVSAKLQEIRVINYELTTDFSTYLYLETSCFSMDRHKRYLVEDQMVEVTTAIVNYFMQKCYPLKMILYHNTRSEIKGSSPQDFGTYYEYLSGITFTNQFSMAEIIDMESSAFREKDYLIAVIHNLNHDFFTYLSMLKQKGIHSMVFIVRHGLEDDIELYEMVDEIKNNGIPAFIIYSHQQIDKVLEEAI